MRVELILPLKCVLTEGLSLIDLILTEHDIWGHGACKLQVFVRLNGFGIRSHNMGPNKKQAGNDQAYTYVCSSL